MHRGLGERGHVTRRRDASCEEQKRIGHVEGTEMNERIERSRQRCQHGAPQDGDWIAVEVVEKRLHRTKPERPQPVRTDDVVSVSDLAVDEMEERT